MGLRRKTASILAFMMGATAILPAPYDTSIRTVYASTVSISDMVQKNTVKKATEANARRATFSNALKFIPEIPEEVPSWYTEAFTKEGDVFYTFVSREGEEQFRIYGMMEGDDMEETGWYSCSSYGAMEKTSVKVDMEEEFVTLAPYLYENGTLSEKEWDILKKNLGDTIESVELAEEMGMNYDGSCYDIWRILTESGEERFFFYGHPVNTLPASGDRWYECDEQGEVIAFFMMKKMAARVASRISCTEKRVTQEGDTVHIYIKGVGFAQRPHLDGIILFNDAEWECTANVANPSHWTTGHSYYAQSGSNSQVKLDFQYLMELGSYCDSDNGVNGVTYTREQPRALIWDGSYKDGNPDYSSNERMVWAESVTWKGTYDYVMDNVNGGDNIFELEITVKNPIPQFTGIAMQLWDGDRRDSDSEGTGYGYESMGNFQITEEITSASGAAHAHTGDFVRTEPDCLKAGSVTGICTLCKKEVNEVLPALGHQVGNPVTEGGYTVTYCSRCHTEMSRKANTYTVKLNANGGSVTTDTKTVTYQSTYGTLPTPVRASYRFDGWYTAAEGGTKVTADSKYTQTGDQTLYAHWTKMQYTFQFDANGGTGGGSITGTCGSPFGTLPSAAREGYTFLGWYTAQTGGSQITASSLVPENTATYYAHWKKNVYTVTFDGNGGSSKASISREYMEELGKLPESERLGYLFQGWFTQKSSGNKVTEKTKMPGENVTYYAQWKPIVYQLRYLGNGAERGTMENSSLTYDTVGKLSDNQYQKTGYLFDGWKDSENNVYDNQAEVRNLASVQGTIVELYAQWKPIRYYFAFYPGSGTGELMQQQEYTYGKSIPLAENMYTKRGYHFSKWTIQEDGSGESFENKQEILNYTTEHNAVISLYAQWEPNTYTMVFDSQGGTCSINEKAVIFDSKIGTLPVPKKLNYKFLGWYDSLNGEQISEETLYDKDRNITVQAAWKLEIKDMGDAVHIRPGEDGVFGTEDDEYYYNGPDQTAGTEDDVRIYSGEDGIYGTEDDFYYHSGIEDAIYAGQDKKFGTEDDYCDLKDGTHKRPGADREWGTGDEELWWNGVDGKPGTADDKHIEKGKDMQYGTSDDYIDLGDGTNLRAGEDLRWGSEDDIVAFHGPDGKPGTEDDFIRDETLREHQRAGEDCIFGTADDVYFWDGLDGKPGTEDDIVIYPGVDEVYKTADDYYVEDSFQAAVYRGQEHTFGKPDNYVDNQDGTNTRVGENEIYENGAGDDKKYLNGDNGIPGDADDKRIERGQDGKYGTEDDCVDNGDGSNTRPGEDGKWGTEDDEKFTNGTDGIPGTEDDKKIDPENNEKPGEEDDKKPDPDTPDTDKPTPDEPNTDKPTPDTPSTDKEEKPGDDNSNSGSSTGNKPGNNSGSNSGSSTGSGSSSGSSSSSGSGSSSSKKNSGSSGNLRNSFSQGRWIQDEKGWWYQFVDGTYPKNSWQYLKYGEREDWYHFDENGYLQTGWFRDVDEHWYHLHTVSDGTLGHMETGWFQDKDGLWYYLNPVSDGHKGAMTVGWRQILDKWYYFNTVSNGTRGSMYAGTVTPDGYLVNEKGEWTGQRADYGKTILSAAWKN